MSLMVPDEMLSHLPDGQRQELLSEAYVFAIAARAGVNMSKPRFDLGTDYKFERVSKVSYGRRDMPGRGIALRCQLKSSKNCELLRNDMIAYRLDADNYNDLIYSSASVLVLLWLRDTIDEWILQTKECLHIHKCAYYYEIQDKDRTEAPKGSTKTIHIPPSQIFTPEALLKLLDKAERGLEPL